MKKRKFMSKVLVVKFGTGNLSSRLSNRRSLFGGEMEKTLDPQVFLDYARQIIELRRQGVKIVVVTSGAIKAGKETVENSTRRASDFDKKELAGIGMIRLLNLWGDAFKDSGMQIAQILVALRDGQDKDKRESIKASISNLLEQGIVPVISDNYIVSDREIKLMEERITEDDRLAAGIASLIGADAVLFLTDQDGIYEDNPETNPKARLLDWIDTRTQGNLGNLINSSTGISEGETGGIKVKLEAAVFCAKREIEVAIAGNKPNVIINFVRGEPVGTRIGAAAKFKVC